MVPRTFLSLPFPYQHWRGSRYNYGAPVDGPEWYFRPLTASTHPGYTGEDQEYDPDSHIPPSYWEQVATCDGLWDDGERLVLITWMNIVVYPSWDVCATWWDRSSGGHRARQELNFVVPPPTELERAGRDEFTLEDPSLEALGTTIDAEVTYNSGITPYVRGFSQARDGSIWSAQEGSVNAICKIRMLTQGPVFGAPKMPDVMETNATGRIAELEAAYYAEDPDAAVAASGLSPHAAMLANTIALGEVQVLYPTFPPPSPPGEDTDPNVEGVQAPVPTNPTQAEIQQVHDAMGPDVYLDRANLYAGRYINRATMISVPRTYFIPGSGFLIDDGSVAPSADAFLLHELDVYSVSAFLVVHDRRVLYSTSGPRGGYVPNVFYAVADVIAGRITGASNVGTGGTFVHPPVCQKLILLPNQPVALAFDEHESRAWAMLVDNTVCCFDYETGEVLSYFWVPLPYSAGSNTVSVKIAWQRNYRRLLVFGILPSKNPADTRNTYDSRIAGYSTTPLPVHVCKPIPLRPVRAGRPTPFLVRQVGSLGEPLAGLATLEPGEGVTVDRALVPLDDTGEAHVLVTASAEGEATLTARIEPAATWDHPVVPVPFSVATYSVGREDTVISNGPWIEGLA